MHVSEYFINERLEYGGTVGKPEGHNKIFVVPSCGGKGSFSFIPLPDADEIVGAALIKFSEISCFPELF